MKQILLFGLMILFIVGCNSNLSHSEFCHPLGYSGYEELGQSIYETRFYCINYNGTEIQTSKLFESNVLIKGGCCDCNVDGEK